MKRLLSLFLVFVMCFSLGFSTVAASNGTLITAADVEVTLGEGVETVDVPVMVSGNTGILGMTLKVGYASGLTLAATAKGEALTTLTYTKPGNLSANPVSFVWDGESDADTANGSIVVLTFNVPAEAGEYEITFATDGVYDDMLDDVAVTTKSAKIIVKEEEVEPKAIFTLDSATAKQGENVDVAIFIESSEAINSIALTDFVFDADALEFVGFSDYAEAFADKMPWEDYPDDENMALVPALSRAQTLEKMQMCIMTFKVKADAEPGEYTVTAAGLTKNGADEVPSAVVPAVITVEEAHVHAYGEWTKVDADTHSKTCACGDVVTENHVYNNEGWKIVDEDYHGKKCEVCDDIYYKTTHDADWLEYSWDTHRKVCGTCHLELERAHEWDDGVVTTAPTVDAEGVKTYTCPICSLEKTESIPKLEPEEPVDGVLITAENVEVVVGTETVEVPVMVSGNTGILGMTLKVGYASGLTLAATAKGEALTTLTYTKPGNLSANPVSFVWDGESDADTANGSIVVLTFNVPDEAGEYEITFTTDGVYDDMLDDVAVTTKSAKIIVKAGDTPAPHEHAYGEWTKVDNDNHSKTCACGDVVTEAHTWDDGVVTTPATHLDAGIKTYTCTACDAEKVEEIPADTDAHAYGECVEVDAETHKQVCACGDEIIEAHTWNDGVVTTPATHTAEGVKTYTCFACSATKTEAIEKTAEHTYVEYVGIDWRSHKMICECGYESSGSHTAAGYKSVGDNGHENRCTLCDYQIAYTEHRQTEIVEEVPATCAEDGYIIYYCKDCKENWKKVQNKTNNHTYGEWTNVDADNHSKECECGDVVTEAHTWDAGVVTLAPTVDAEGVKTYTCSACNGTKTESIPKLEVEEPVDGVLITAENVEVVVGTETVDVPVMVSGNTGILGMTLKVGYASGLTLASTAKGEALTTLTYTKPGNLSANPVSFVWDGESDADTANGSIVVLTFNVPAEAGEYEITFTTDGVYDDMLDDVAVTTKSAKIIVKAGDTPDPHEHAYGEWTKVDNDNHSKTCACGDVVTEAHTWDDGVVTTPATHLDAGIKTYTCTACDAEKVEEIPADTDAHAYGECVEVDAETHKQVCACGDEIIEAHTWNDGVVTTPATHTAEGVKTYTCFACSATKTEAIAKTTEHTYGDWTNVDADNHSKECECGDVVTEAHTWNAGVVTAEPTVDAEGVKTYTCSACSATKTEAIPKLEPEEPVDGVLITAENVEVVVGTETVDVPVMVSGNTGILGMTLKVGYASGLTLAATAKGEALTTLTYTKPGNLSANPVSFVWDGESDADTANGSIVVLTFNVPDEAGEYEITFTTDGVYDDMLDDVAVTTKSAKIIVKTPAPHEHAYGEWTEVDADNHSKECACGDVVTEAHTWDAGVVTLAPTHTEEGIKTYTCSACSATKTEAIEKTAGHAYGEWTNVDDNNHSKTCECGDVVTEAHTWDAGVVTLAPTHTEEGVKTYTCSACDAEKTETIAKTTDHAYGDWTEVDADNHSKTCACGDEIIEAHTWDAGVVTLAPTHTEEGVKTYTCSACDAEKTETIAKTTDHTYGDWTKVDDNNHSKTCECSDVVTEAHTWDDGVVTTPATHLDAGIKTYTCTACDAEKVEEIPADADAHTYGECVEVDAETHKQVCACGDEIIEAHTWNDGVVTTPATHTAEGVKTYTCFACSATKTEAIAKTTDHAYGDWTKVDDNNHSKTCACGDVVTEAHTWDAGVETTPPTVDAEGVKTYTCSACSATKTEAIPKLEPEEPVDGVLITAENVEVVVGTETVEVPVMLSGNTGILGMTLKVGYASGLTLAETAKGEALSTLTFTKPGNLSANPVNFVWDGEADADTANGLIVVLTFNVPAEAGEYEITFATDGVYDDVLDDVAVTTKSAKIIVKEAPACEHVWDAGVVTTPATHLAEGVMTYTCTLECGATKTEAIAKTTEHTYGDWTEVDADNHSKECACGDVVTEAHTWDAGVVTTPATHLAEGVMTYTCEACSATKTEVIEKTTEHTYGDWTNVDADNHSKECACGDVVTEAHTWDAGVVTTPATHLAEGVMTYTCEACDATKTEVIEKTTEHTYGDWTEVDADNHQGTCACGDVVTEAHTWDAGVVTTPATHLAEGVMTYTCTKCDATKTEVIEKTTEHTYGDWTEVDADNHQGTCACGDVKTEAHTWDNGVVTLEPTYDEEGEKTFTCTKCDATKVEAVDKLVVPSRPSSGGLVSGGGASAPQKPVEPSKPVEPTTPVEPEVPVEPTTPSTPVAGNFGDLGNHAWAADAIEELAEAGIIKGTSKTTFAPAANITRADFAILLVRAFNLESDGTENFADVSASDYFAKEIAIMKNSGLIGGIGDNKFAPKAAITRQDMMVIVHRVLEKLDVALSDGEVEHADFDKLPDYAKDAATALISSGLINGKDGLIDGSANTTRAEVAVLLQRILDFVENK